MMDIKNELYDQLMAVEWKNAETILLEKRMQLQNEKQAFANYIRQLRKDRQVRWKDVAIEIGINPRRLYKLISGEKRTRNRDLIILIGLCLHVSPGEMQSLLALYGFSILYIRRKRDALLLKMLQEQQFSISKVNEFLLQYGAEPLQATQSGRES